MAESKTPIMLERGAEYLDLVRFDPDSHPPTVKAMTEYVGVSRRLWYKADPDIQAIVSDLEELRDRTSRGPTLALEAENASRFSGLSDDELRKQVSRTEARLTWAMKQFVGQRGNGNAFEELSLVLYDLDTCMGKLRSARMDLAALHDEVQRRGRSQAD